jgi:hypothetical protein
MLRGHLFGNKTFNIPSFEFALMWLSKQRWTVVWRRLAWLLRLHDRKRGFCKVLHWRFGLDSCLCGSFRRGFGRRLALLLGFLWHFGFLRFLRFLALFVNLELLREFSDRLLRLRGLLDFELDLLRWWLFRRDFPAVMFSLMRLLAFFRGWSRTTVLVLA